MFQSYIEDLESEKLNIEKFKSEILEFATI